MSRPNGLKDLESDLEFKLKLDSQVKQSNSSTDNENHDSCDAIYNVKAALNPRFNLPLKYCISIVIAKKNSPTPPVA